MKTKDWLGWILAGPAVLVICLALGACAGLTRTAAGPAPEGMVLVPAGEFMMGSRDSIEEIIRKGGGEPQHYQREFPRHRVIISKPFYLMAREVSNDQFAAFVAATGRVTDAERHGYGHVWSKGFVQKRGANWRHPQGPGSDIIGRGDHPVVQVSWSDAQAYCRWLGSRDGRRYRLPSEAEWEYACRAGTTTPFAFGETISADQVNYFAKKPYPGGEPGVYRAGTTPVGSLAANAWGLYDMHGNVWEWCQDRLDVDYYSYSPEKDPQGPPDGAERVVRGGAYNFSAVGVRSARRWGRPADQGYSQVGFRVAADE
ncbi:MAG: formylglycine-generating enzyme family protein [Thermodesulfobacteriota bacterium]